MKLGFEVGADINDALNKFKELKKELVKVKDELKSVATDVKIKVALDSAPVISQARQIRNNLQNAIGEVKVKLTVDSASVAADAARIRGQVQTAIGETRVKVKLDSAGLVPQLAHIKNQINAYFASNVGAIRISLALTQADIAAIRARLASLAGAGNKIKLGIDLAHLNSQIAIARTMLASLVTGGVRINIDASATNLIAALNALKLEVERLRLAMRSGGPGPGPGPGGGPGGLAAMTGQVMALVAGLASLAGLTVITKMSDEAALLRARFEQLLDTQEEVDATQKRLYESAQRLGVSYKDMSDSAARMLPAMQQQKKGAEEAIKLAEILQVTAVLSGSTTAEAASVAQQFGQALGAGTLQAEELNSILDGNQMLARTLAEALKLPESSIEVTVGMLKKLASEGKITSEVLAEALLGSYDKIMSQADQMPKTFSRVWNNIKNLALKVVGDLNKQGFFDGAINSLDALFKKLQELEQNGTIKEWAEGVGSTLGALGSLFIELAGIVTDVVGEIVTLWSDLAGSVEEGTGAQIGFFDLLTNSIKVVHVAFIGLRTGVQIVFAAIKDTIKDTVATTVALFATFKSAINIAMITVGGSVETLITLLQTLATVAQKALMLDFDGAVAAWDSGTEKLAGIVKKRADQIAKEQQDLKNKYQAAAATSATFGGGADYAGIAQQGRDRINEVLLGTGTGGGKTAPGKATFTVPKVAVGAGSSTKADSDAKKAAKELVALDKEVYDNEKALINQQIKDLETLYRFDEVSFAELITKKQELNEKLYQLEMAHIQQKLNKETDATKRKQLEEQRKSLINDQKNRENELANDLLSFAKDAQKFQNDFIRELNNKQVSLNEDLNGALTTQLLGIEESYNNALKKIDEFEKKLGNAALNYRFADGSQITITKDLLKKWREQLNQQAALEKEQATKKSIVAQVNTDVDSIVQRQRQQEDTINRANDQSGGWQSVTASRGINASREQAYSQLAAQKKILEDLKESGMKGLESQIDAITEKMLALQEVIPTTFQAFVLGIKEASQQALASSLNDFFTDLIDGSKSAGEALRDFVGNFARAIGQIIVQAMAAYAALIILNAIPGGAAVAKAMDFAATAKHASDARKVSAGSNHTGGMAGGGPRRQLDASLYLGAPKYHVGGIAGLAPGEIPAVLMQGEEVLTRDDPRHVANGGGQSGQSIRIINVFTKEQALEYLASSEGEKVQLNMVERNASAIKRILGDS